jgi:hypothetical protein
VFTRGVLGELLHRGSNEVFSDVVRRYVEDPEDKTHGELFSEIYAYLGKEQRNEYYYMNTLLNKLLAGFHSVETTTALSKIRIGQAIADFVMINGEGSIYVLEVKSELDNFDRLRHQVSNYFKAFGKVTVLVSKQNFGRVERVLAEFGKMGEFIGIRALSASNTISRDCRREPKQFDDCLDHGSIFAILRKREYENALMRHWGNIPQVPPVFHFQACLERFRQIPILEAQNLAFDELKKRNKITKTAFESIQHELKSVIYFSELTSKLPEIEQLLQTAYAG